MSSILEKEIRKQIKLKQNILNCLQNKLFLNLIIETTIKYTRTQYFVLLLNLHTVLV